MLPPTFAQCIAKEVVARKQETVRYAGWTTLGKRNIVKTGIVISPFTSINL